MKRLRTSLNDRAAQGKAWDFISERSAMELTFETLKWVALVFLAGVIGQLGKSLTLRIIDARRRRRKGKNSKALSDGELSPGRNHETSKEQRAESDMSHEERKARKKEAKIEMKRRKKE